MQHTTKIILGGIAVRATQAALVVAAVAAGVFIGTKAAHAQDLAAATGSKSGVYYGMATELKKFCPNPSVAVQESTGSVANIDALVNNRVNMAWLQSDMLFMTKATDAAKVANIKTLAGMHPEELHFIARADVKKEGGYGFGKYKFGGNDVTFTTLSDLSGRAVGAVGGSVLSGRVVSQFANLKFNVVEFPNNDALKAALLDGTVDSILVVGGAPHPLVQSLDARFRLLPVSADTARVLKDIYAPAKVTYSNLNAAGVDTISTQAVLASRTYNSKAMLDKLKALRACFIEKLPEIKDTTGTHPKWQQVEINKPGEWPLYDLR